jgi:mycothiol synthase
MHLRPVDLPNDLVAVGRLLGRVESADGHQPIAEHQYLTLFQGNPERVVGLVAEAGGQMVSYIALTPNAEPGWWGMELAVDPVHRSHEAFIDLFNAGLNEVASRGGRAVRAWLFQPRLAEAALEAGFEPERELLRLERQLPGGFQPDRPDANLPEGMNLEPFRPGHDEQAWLEVNNGAFPGHPENGRWTLEILDNRMSQKWFHPDDLLMAWDGSNLAGFCWVKRSEGIGEIYVVAVAPKHQGAGLGRALVLQGLSVMEAKRDRTAVLYVDASNHRALGLYRSLGFIVDHVDRSFVRILL